MQVAASAVACGLLLIALAMDHSWTYRHLLPDLMVPMTWFTTLVAVERVLLVLAAGVVLFLVRPAIDRMLMTGGARGEVQIWLGATLALLLAIPASEGALRLSGSPESAPDAPPPLPSPLTGWVNAPSRIVVDTQYRTKPVYVLDRHGYRVASPDVAVDREAPSILFAGESVMFGKGLNWPETIPARVAAMSGIQTANLAVPRYSVSQTYLHLRSELRRFRHPVAVVILFGPLFMTRDLSRTRPWIDHDGRWHPGSRQSALGELRRVLLPYHSPAAIEATIAAERFVLRAEVALARARGAEPIVLVPVYQPEQPRERELRAALFGEGDIPHVVVPLDPRWRLFPNRHPDARADRAMAIAVWQRLVVSKEAKS